MILTTVVILTSTLMPSFAAANNTKETKPAVKPTAAPTEPPLSPESYGYAEYAKKLDETSFNGQLGAIYSPSFTTFRLWSPVASDVKVCIYKTGSDSEKGAKTLYTYPMNYSKQYGTWYLSIKGDFKNMYYTYLVTVNGTTNEVVDPYAKAVDGCLGCRDELFGYKKYSRTGGNGRNRDDFTRSFDSGRRTDPLDSDARDSAPYMLKSVVVDDTQFCWEGDKPLQIPLNETVIYEMHVKGFSKLNERIPAPLRGTYKGLAHPASVSYLKELGITAVELLPVHLSVSEGRLTDMGLSNYWGYNSLGFFCPDPRFSSDSDVVNEFKFMVKELHRNGLEVILDVVYNHTAEQGNDGPQLCYRGLDNSNYYRLEPQCCHIYHNFTGCGNSINTTAPRTLQLIMDSLRYWVGEMHVDGFRFDLATTLARSGFNNEYNRYSGFLSAVAQDPLLGRTKLIAEPWDCGPGGYQVGGFPKGWSEWNGDWRDVVRRFWRGDGGLLGKLASKLSGSSDLYWDRSPLAIINFVTAHDGFTLNDLVTYHQKRNQQNGEGNRDGTIDNNNWNCGVEGPTGNPAVVSLRRRQMRNMLLTPISPNLCVDRSLVLPDTDTICFELGGNVEAIISPDGYEGGPLDFGDQIRARASEHSALFVRFGDKGIFYRNITRYMQRNPTIKGDYRS